LKEKVKILERNQKALSETLALVSSQHVDLIKQQRQVAKIQQQLAEQIVIQQEQMEELLLALGIKKPLSYYSYNMQDAPGN